MNDDTKTPATKADIQLLMAEIGKLYDATEQWKEQVIEEVNKQTAEQIAASEARMKRHFEVVAEDMRHDFQGAFRDKLEQHEERIVRLEQKARLRSA